MKLPKLKRPRINYLALAFLFPCVSMLILMLIAGYTPFGNKSMLYSDMWHQYYPFFKEFRRALLSGDSILYSWNVGMGLDYLGLISYYLASPLNLLSVLVPESWTLQYFELLMPIKLGLAGLFFAIFLKKTFRRDDLSLPLFGAFYAMCAWALGYQWNIMWLDTFALLPLVVLGTLQLLQEKKFILYTITLFLSVFINYYIGLFTCIFVLLTFICYQICNCRSFKRLISDLCRIALFTVLAIGMTAILELPALGALQNTQSSVNTFPEGFSLNIVDSKLCMAAQDAWEAYKAAKDTGDATFRLWWTAMKESFGPIMTGMALVAGNMGGGIEPTFKEGLPNLYCGVGTIILAFLFLTSTQVKLREKLCSLFLLSFFMLSFIVRQLDYIWHGFHFTNQIPYRFSFLFSFVLLYMAYRAYSMRHRFKLWQIIAAGILSAVLLFSSDKVSDEVYLAYNCVFFLLFMGLLIYNCIEFPLPKKQTMPVLSDPEEAIIPDVDFSVTMEAEDSKTEHRKALQEYFADRKQRRSFATWGLCAVMAVELILNLVNFGIHFPYTSLVNYPSGKEYTASMIRYMKEDDDLFYRAETTHAQTLNDGALNGYNGISTFTSSANVKTTQFMRSLGYGAKNTYNRYCYEESSPVSNLFLGIKYMIERDGNVELNPYFTEKHHYGSVYLLENNAYLPLGFLAQSDLADFEFKSYGNSFLFQNALFRAATGVEKNVWSITPTSCLTIEPNGTNVTGQSAAGYVAYDNSEKTVLNYNYEIIRSGFMCLDLTMSARNSYSVWLNGKQLYSESMSLPQTIAVSQVEPGDTVQIRITCKADESGSITIRAGLLDEEIFREGYEVLNASTMELTSFSNTKVEGTINCNRDGLLYTSIPQNGSWHLTVDGEEVETVLVGDCMLAVQLSEGRHALCFTYENEAFSLGWKVSMICLLIFLAITVVVYRKRIQCFIRSFKK